MASQWENFLRNLGEWHGSFASLTAEGVELERTASILSLQQGPEERLVQFHLRRFSGSSTDGTPSREVREDYRSLGRQVVFFETGAFSKGSQQVAPQIPFGAEFGFVHHDRRFRLVQLHSASGAFESLVLIREFRAGSQAEERPPLESTALLGPWQGQAATISADWPEPELASCQIAFSTAPNGALQIRTAIGSAVHDSGATPESRLLLLPDSGFSVSPLQVSHRQPFAVEAGWLPSPGRLERLIRRYDASGAWLSSSHIVATQV
jgi:hypothetical protein